MSAIPTIPGLSDYPDLELQFRQKYRAAKNTRGCSKCEASKVVQVYRNALRSRRERDKLRKNA